MYVTHLLYSKCELTYESEQPIQLCTCGAPLLVGYDLDRVRNSLSKEVLASRKPTLWRYRELLPIRKDENILSLGEPMTPVMPLGRLGPEVGMPHLFMKENWASKSWPCPPTAMQELPGPPIVPLPASGPS